MKFPVIGIIVPCFNEESVIAFVCKKLNSVLEKLKNDKVISPESLLCFVDDGSEDSTWQMIRDHRGKLQNIMGIKLTRNYGHQAALMAGINSLMDICDGVITIDADLQHDIDIIPEMIDHFKSGRDIVYAVKASRDKDTFFKRTSAHLYYKLMSLFGTEIIYNHADYRFLNKKIMQSLLQYKERNVFLRGLMPLISGNSEIVYFEVKKRISGKSKYSWKKMLYLAWDGITSFSTIPLRLITCFGIIICFSCFFLMFYVLFFWVQGKALPGWASTVLPIYFLGGIQLLSLGVIGEYMGKIYTEVKNRPLFHIEKIEYKI